MYRRYIIFDFEYSKRHKLAQVSFGVTRREVATAGAWAIRCGSRKPMIDMIFLVTRRRAVWLLARAGCGRRQRAGAI